MHIFMQATAQTESLHTAVVTQSDTTVLRVLEKKGNRLKAKLYNSK